jgi:stage V sporulation protein AE
MEIFLQFLWCFLIGGAICLFGQILIMKTNFTPARILVFFVTIGVILAALSLYEPILEFAGSGISTPITGFGGTLTRGTIEAVKEDGFLGILTGGLTAAAAGIAVATVSAFVVAMISKSRSK